MPRYQDVKKGKQYSPEEEEKEESPQQGEDKIANSLKEKIASYNFLQDLFTQASQQQFTPKPIQQVQQRPPELIDPYAEVIGEKTL